MLDIEDRANRLALELLAPTHLLYEFMKQATAPQGFQARLTFLTRYLNCCRTSARRMLTPDDFVVELGAYRLKDERRKVFFTKFEERLNEEISHPLFGYKVTYRRCLELQVRLVAKFVTGEIEEYPPFLIK